MTVDELLKLKGRIEDARVEATNAHAAYVSAVIAMSGARDDALAQVIAATKKLKAARLDYTIAQAGYSAEGKGPTDETPGKA